MVDTTRSTAGGPSFTGASETFGSSTSSYGRGTAGNFSEGTQDVETRETHDLIASDKVEGTLVYNRQGEKLGSIERVMIEKVGGKVAYAVLSFGGFLGIGDQHHPLPWGVLKYDTTQGGYVVDLDKAKLEGAPSFDRSENFDYSNRDWGKRVHDYWGVTPYWI